MTSILKNIIKNIKARQILTSRGIPTVEVEFVLDTHSIFSSVPSGKSTGTREACNIIDNGNSYNGQSVKKVIETILKYKNVLLNREIEAPEQFDKFLIKLDGTESKSSLGANFSLPLSICYYKFYSNYLKIDLHSYLSKSQALYKIPIPYFNVLNGGLHSGNNLSCQEIMIAFNRSTYSENLEMAATFYQGLKTTISKKYGSIYQSVGDEGGFAPPIKTTEEGLDLLVETGECLNISDFSVGLDLAANSFYSNGQYTYDNQQLSGKELANTYISLIKKYKMIKSIEDPFHESDFESWKYFYHLARSKVCIIADDLTVTNSKLISEYAPMKMFDGVLIKPNQIGTVLETLEAVELSKSLGFIVMISHRSAETEDTFISSLAVGVHSDFIKSGAPCRGERVCKYNELLRIEESINESNQLFD